MRLVVQLVVVVPPLINVLQNDCVLVVKKVLADVTGGHETVCWPLLKKVEQGW